MGLNDRNGDAGGCGCPVGCVMTPLVGVGAILVLAYHLITFKWFWRVQRWRLGLDLSVESGFCSFKWGTSTSGVTAKLGEPTSREVENGVTNLRYYPKKKLFGGGLHSQTFIFFNDQLIAGESSAMERRRDGFKGAYRAATTVLTNHCKQYVLPGISAAPVETGPDVLVWVVGIARTRLMLHRHDAEPGVPALLTLTSDDGRQNNELQLLARYGGTANR